MDIKKLPTILYEMAQCLYQDKKVNIHIISADSKSPMKFSNTVTSFHLLAEDRGLWIAYINKLSANTQNNVILPCGEPDVEYLVNNSAKLAEHINLHYLPSIESLNTAINKDKLAAFLIKNKISCPPTIKLPEYSLLRDEDFPVLLKPLNLSGGRGIEIFKTLGELASHISNIVNKERFIIQQFTGDIDIDCSVLCKDGEIIVYTIQKSIIPHKKRFLPPAVVEFVDNKEVYNTVKHMMQKLNWSGIAHIDLRYDSKNNKAFVIEVNARYWASLIGSMMAGVNFPLIASYKALGLPYHQQKMYNTRYARISYILSVNKNKIKLSETNLRYLLRDPLPKILIKLRKIICRNLLGNKSAI